MRFVFGELAAAEFGDEPFEEFHIALQLQRDGETAGTMNGDDEARRFTRRAANGQPVPRGELLGTVYDDKLRRYDLAELFGEAVFFPHTRLGVEADDDGLVSALFELGDELFNERSFAHAVAADDAGAPAQFFEPLEQCVPGHPDRKAEGQTLDFHTGKWIFLGAHGGDAGGEDGWWQGEETRLTKFDSTHLLGLRDAREDDLFSARRDGDLDALELLAGLNNKLHAPNDRDERAIEAVWSLRSDEGKRGRVGELGGIERLRCDYCAVLSPLPSRVPNEANFERFAQLGKLPQHCARDFLAGLESRDVFAKAESNHSGRTVMGNSRFTSGHLAMLPWSFTAQMILLFEASKLCIEFAGMVTVTSPAAILVRSRVSKTV